MGKLAWIRSTKARRKPLFDEPEKDALCLFQREPCSTYLSYETPSSIVRELVLQNKPLAGQCVNALTPPLREISSPSLWMPPSLQHMRELSRNVRQTPKSHQQTINNLSLYLSLYVSIRCCVVVVGEIEGELYDPSCVDEVMMNIATKQCL